MYGLPWRECVHSPGGVETLQRDRDLNAFTSETL